MFLSFLTFLEPIPNITPLLQPTRWGDFAAYFFFSLGGLFVGGETGLLTGTSGAARSIRRDPGREKKIENAYRRFRVDALRKEADRLEMVRLCGSSVCSAAPVYI